MCVKQSRELEGLPAATLIHAEIDPLLSEGQMLAARLKAAGVKTNATLYMGVTHEFFGMSAVVAKAKLAVHSSLVVST